MNLRRSGWLTLFVCSIATSPLRTAFAQGVAGASVRGSVSTEPGSPIANARVSLVSASTGNVFKTVTRDDGGFAFENVPVGGPYSLEATAIGMRPSLIGGITLHLGDKLVRQLVLNGAQAHTMEDIVVRGSGLRDAGSGGPAYSIPGEAVRGVPLLDRDFTGLLGMTSQAVGSNKISVSGQNDKFNALQVDGGSGNDHFFPNLPPGSRAGAKSLSLEAIQEIKIVVAPFDVRQGGFSGGLINAVTRSGTNHFRASAFVSQSGSDLVGPDTAGARIHGVNTTQYGVTVGGPLIRDRLHFFALADLQSRRTLFEGPSASDPATGISDSTARRAERAFLSKYGFVSGGPESPVLRQPNYNVFSKLTFQGSRRHLIALSHTSFGGTSDELGRTTRNRNNRDGWQLSNSGTAVRTDGFTTRLTVSSMFGSISNEAIASVGAINSLAQSNNRVPLFLVQGDIANTYLAGGSVKAATDTRTDQRTVEFTDNISLTRGSHTLTFGTQNQFHEFRDTFFLGSWGVWTFGSVSALEQRDALRYEVALPLRPGGPLADFRAAELAAYFQDRWSITPQLTVTAGLRTDLPFFAAPIGNPSLAANAALGRIDTRDIPSGNRVLSPRLGFAYALGKNNDYMFRGGVGGFAGRPPYAWITNAYVNTGQDQSLLICGPSNGVPAPTTDITRLPSACLTTSSFPVPSVTYFDRNFRFQQAVKYVLGVDHQLSSGLTLSLDVSHTRTRNSFFVTDVNLAERGPDAEDRMMYGTITTAGVIRPARIDAGFGQVFRFENRTRDRSTAVSALIDKRWSSSGLLEIGYTWSRTSDLMSIVGNNGPLILQNSPIAGTMKERQLQRSARDIPHNLVATLVAPRTIFDLTASLFFRARSGAPYAYVANGDANADGTQSNDLAYVPRDASDVSLKNPQAYAALDSFILSEKCLREQRGRIMSRTSCRNPAVWRLDGRLSKPLRLFHSQTVELSADLFNVPNMLHRNWGLTRETSIREGVGLLAVAGWDAAANRPVYSVPAVNGVPVLPSRNQVVVDASRWKIQLGARYNF